LEIINLFFAALLGHGAIGLLSFAGWGLACYFLYRDYNKKESVNADIKSRDKIISEKDAEIARTKDKTAEIIKEMAENRHKDLKELIGDYNQIVLNVTRALDKMSDSLEVKTK